MRGKYEEMKKGRGLTYGAKIEHGCPQMRRIRREISLDWGRLARGRKERRGRRGRGFYRGRILGEGARVGTSGAMDGREGCRVRGGALARASRSI
jgi:hypothetical protein